ncbi:MAG: type 1 glutamine amidotransferase [Nannocystis sp.]|nr:type 1 glutamine amidotransferase domain-containing protein [Nannocystis sp.]MBA3548540.1 type 1 glutamine amidotransferase [Nannocystis sp.]
MQTQLSGQKIAILVTNGFEQVELTEPREALQDVGAEADIVSPEKRSVKAWKSTDWGDSFEVDVALAKARPENYQALLLPGGVLNPDSLRTDEDAIAFIRHFVTEGKPIAAICHGPWTLIEAGAASGRMMTSYPSLRTDLRNAGAHWVDEPVVVDRGLVTSRNPGDLKVFNKKMIEVFVAGARRGL